MLALALLVQLLIEPPGENTPHIAPFSLMLTVHTPGRMPDGHRSYPMPSLEKCWESAKAYLETEVPEGAIGISAACGKSKQTEHPL